MLSPATRALFIAIFLLFSAIAPSVADACSCAWPAPEVAFEQAEVVLHARVVSQEKDYHGRSTLEVIEVWKGDVVASIVLSAPSSMCSAFPMLDDEVIIYAKKTSDDPLEYTIPPCARYFSIQSKERFEEERKRLGKGKPPM